MEAVFGLDYGRRECHDWWRIWRTGEVRWQVSRHVLLSYFILWYRIESYLIVFWSLWSVLMLLFPVRFIDRTCHATVIYSSFIHLLFSWVLRVWYNRRYEVSLHLIYPSLSPSLCEAKIKTVGKYGRTAFVFNGRMIKMLNEFVACFRAWRYE